MSVNTLIFEFLDEYVNYWCDKLPITTSEIVETEIISVCDGDYLTDENGSPWRLIRLYDPNDGRFIGKYDIIKCEILFKQEDKYETQTFSIPPTDGRAIKYHVINEFDVKYIIEQFRSYSRGYDRESEIYKKTTDILETNFKNNINKNQLIHDIYNMLRNTNITEHINYVIQQYFSKHVLK